MFAEADTGETTELRVLMLEDSPTDAELTEREMRRAGISFTAKRVDTRESFETALDAFRPDIILSDYKLPEYDGLSAIKLVRHDHPEIPIIIVTGALADTDAAELLASGARDYVLKDRLARLAPAIRHVLSAEKGIRARKAAEHALHETYRQVERARDEWNAAFDAMRDLVFFHDREHRVTRCNRAYARQAGLPFNEIIGRPYWEIFPKNDGPLFSCDNEMEENAGSKEEEITLHSGETFISRSFSARDGEGAYLFSVHIMEDISERKRSEELIRKNNQLLETAFSSIHVMVAYLDRDFNFIKVNKAYANADHRAPDFFPGRNHFSLYPDEENKGIFQRVVETGEPAMHYAKPFMFAGHPERGVGYWDWRLDPVKGASGRVEGLLLSVLNVTAQTLALQKLEAASKYARSLIEASLDPLVTISADGKITDVNVATEKATGRSRAELIGTDFSDYFTDPDKARAGYQEAFQRGFVTDYPLALRHRDGHVMDVLYNASVYRDDSGNVMGVFAAARDITELNKNEKALQRLNRALKALSAGNHALVHSRNELELMQGMCSAITDGNNYPLAWVGEALLDENKSIRPVALAGSKQGYVEALHLTWADELLGRGPTGAAVRTGQTQICQDFAADSRMEPWREASSQYGLASSIALPLRDGATVTGALTLYAAEPGAFDPQEVALLEELVEDLNFGLQALRTRGERDRALEERQHYADRLRSSLEEALQAISATVEMRDPYTAGHQRRVAELGAAIAREIGLPEEQIHGIHLAAIVHDLGKIHVPAEILSKPVQLSDVEFRLVRIHPQAGYDILRGIAFPWPIAQAVLQHHERMDGSGYPQGLKGEAITLEARILAVADVVEAMASHRPYRPSLGLDSALSEIRAKRGTQFDPAVVDACTTLFEKRNYILPT